MSIMNDGTYQKTLNEMNAREVVMQISYKKLWKLLIDKDMQKKDLLTDADISWSTITKMSKDKPVSMEMLLKVCEALKCNIGDIVDFVPDKQ